MSVLDDAALMVWIILLVSGTRVQANARLTEVDECVHGMQ